jgi:hypothetical protein
MLFSETETAKQNQKFPFHFFFRFAAEGWGEEAREKCKEIFWFLHTRVRERVRGALSRITTQSERTRQFQVTTRSARAKSVRVLLEMGSNFFKQTPQRVLELRTQESKLLCSRRGVERLFDDESASPKSTCRCNRRLPTLREFAFLEGH